MHQLSKEGRQSNHRLVDWLSPMGAEVDAEAEGALLVGLGVGATAVRLAVCLAVGLVVGFALGLAVDITTAAHGREAQRMRELEIHVCTIGDGTCVCLCGC